MHRSSLRTLRFVQSMKGFNKIRCQTSIKLEKQPRPSKLTPCQCDLLPPDLLLDTQFCLFSLHGRLIILYISCVTVENNSIEGEEGNVWTFTDIL